MKKNFIKIGISIGLLFTIFLLQAQERPLLTVKEMRKDINYYFNTLKQQHPNLYAYITPKQMDSIKKQVLKRCSHPMSLLDFDYALAQTKKYVDGHTGIYTNELFALSARQKANYFPCVTFKNDQIILDNAIVIDSINGIPSDQLAKEVDLLVSWENNPVFRQEKMNEYLSPVLYNIYHTEPPFICSRPNLPDTLVAPVSQKKAKPPVPPRYTQAHLTNEYFIEDSIAVLCYNSSLIFQGYEQFFTSYTKEFFQQLKNHHIKYLFIDVSHNGGGSDLIHEYILKYLKSQPYKYQSHTRAKKKGALKGYEEFYKHISGGKTLKELSQYEKWKIDRSTPWVEQLWKPLIKHGKKEGTTVSQGNKKGFKGTVFVIMGPYTFSSAHSFCKTIKRGQIGFLVGEPSGQRSPFCGNLVLNKLPESGITFYYPTSYNWEEPALPYKDGFLQPDVDYPIYGKVLGIEDYKKIIQLSKALEE
ncbi:S41 family peptidase [Parabacteroides pacaensis]|uniref:S41 family peptidase n=1 Tax=Parabacteroides pacaensis TaxID=2086575 RepID=UPI000D1103E0|nr:S41 family peptidase [Parabacteroides pacaensis]